jgi:hypothetical protein
MLFKKSRILTVLGAVVLLLVLADEVFAVIGRPLTPVSVAGVARRSVRRNAYYGAAYPY